MLRVYNTLSEKKEDFIPLQEGKVGLYACGMTVYDKPHIGHARKEVAIDLIVSYLRYSGYQVTYVRNFTDVDDNIIRRANDRGVSCDELTAENIAAFYRAVDALGLTRPDVEPKATEHMAEIITIVEKLIEKGHAYAAADGSVYFAVESFTGYGKLSNRKLDELLAGTRFEPEAGKRNPLDFALWKSAKPGEPSWASPWGKGRPGWHIECSAMSSKYLGDSFDIHAGGRDLIFPHHENEIAQSEAASGKPFVKYWVHNGFLTVEGEKMSKSLGNFITVDDALDQYHPEVLRLFMLSTHYRTPIDFSYAGLADAERRVSYFYETMKLVAKIAGDAAPKKSERSEAFIAEFRESMEDDFNSPKVLAALIAFCKFLNEAAVSKKTRPAADEAAGYLAAIGEVGKVFGILQALPAERIAAIQDIQLKRAKLTRGEIDALIAERNAHRKEKNFAAADEVRGKLDALGILIKDTPDGTEWSFK